MELKLCENNFDRHFSWNIQKFDDQFLPTTQNADTPWKSSADDLLLCNN